MKPGALSSENFQPALPVGFAVWAWPDYAAPWWVWLCYTTITLGLTVWCMCYAVCRTKLKKEKT